ncbi:unnamed protein product, partial [Gulo gulo]
MASPLAARLSQTAIPGHARVTSGRGARGTPSNPPAPPLSTGPTCSQTEKRELPRGRHRPGNPPS